MKLYLSDRTEVEVTSTSNTRRFQTALKKEGILELLGRLTDKNLAKVVLKDDDSIVKVEEELTLSAINLKPDGDNFSLIVSLIPLEVNAAKTQIEALQDELKKAEEFAKASAAKLKLLEPIMDVPQIVENMEQYADVIAKAVQSLDEKILIKVPAILPAWRQEKEYSQGYIVRYKQGLYKVIKNKALGTPPDIDTEHFKLIGGKE